MNKGHFFDKIILTLQPLFDFPFAFAEWAAVKLKRKCKGRFNIRELRTKPSIQLSNYFEVAGAKYRHDKHNFMSFAKTVACTLEGDCEDWAKLWYEIAKGKGKRYLIWFRYKHRRWSHVGTLLFCCSAIYYFTLWYVHVFNSMDEFNKYLIEDKQYKDLDYYVLYKPIF